MGQTRSRKIMASLLGLIFLSVFALLPQPSFADSMIEKFPTSTSVIVAGWNNPINAYANDGNYTDASQNNVEQEYADFGFNFTTETIEKVFLKMKGYGWGYKAPSGGDEGVAVVERFYDGLSWDGNYYTPIYIILQSGILGLGEEFNYGDLDVNPTTKEFDITSAMNTVAKLNAVKIRIIKWQVVEGDNDDTIYVDSVSVEVAYTTPTEENMEQYFLVGATMTFFIVLVIKSKKQQP